VTEKNIRDEDLDSTIATLEEGLRSLPVERAISEVDGWQKRLEASGDPGLKPIVVNLRELKELLAAEGTFENPDVARLLVELGDRAQAVAVSGTASPVADKLQLLSHILTEEGRLILEGEYPEGM
jgi:putative N-acetylmannosamine-6-phosphate epimerase